jgi:hypothetical protein
MRTREACATRLSFIIAMIVSAATAVWLSAVPAHALTGSVQVNNGTPCNFGSATATGVTLPASCGGVTISARPGTAAAQAAALVSGGSQNQVVIRNALIKNTTAGSKTVKITATHNFSSTVVASTAQRSYAIGLNASFARKNSSNALVLASGNSISKRGSYTYSCTGCVDGIGGLVTAGNANGGTELKYTVPSIGSTTLNTIPIPAPSASEPTTSFPGPRNCQTSFGKACGPGETLGTVLTVVLSQINDTVTIPGGDHTAAGGCPRNPAPGCDPDVFPEAVLLALAATAFLHQNTPNPVVNTNDNGQLAVNLICNMDPNIDFSCETVDQASLRFVPAGAQPTSVQLRDINNDGIMDLKATFANQETGIMCNDTMATLSGTNTFPGFGLIEFDAPVGFGTSPGC